MRNPRRFVEKCITIMCRGWLTCREMYSPGDALSREIFEYGSLRKIKNNFTFEDLVYFHKHGWAIKYFGMKSKKLPLLDAEYLGEDGPQEKKKK
jgi:hypothetical protein